MKKSRKNQSKSKRGFGFKNEDKNKKKSDNNSTKNDLFLRVIKYYQLQQFQEAENCLKKILELAPNHADSWHLLGVISAQQGNYEQAIKQISRAIKLKPNFLEAYNNLVLTYINHKQFKSAIQPLKKLTELQPNNPENFLKLGCIYKDLEQFLLAIDSFQKAIKINPNNPNAYNNLGYLYQEIGKLSNAENCFKQAIKQQPKYIEAYNNIGELYREKGELDQAQKAFQQAIRINPNNAQAYYNLGNVYRDSQNFSESIKCYQKALEINPNYIEAFNNLGNFYKNTGNVAKAIKCYQKSLRIKEDYIPSIDNLLLCLHYTNNYEPLEIYDQHLHWVDSQASYLINEISSYKNSFDSERRLRIGYVSGDFKTHSVAYFLEPLLKTHNHSQFEIICYSNTKKTDATTERLRTFADEWRNIYKLKDEEVVELIRQDLIDILIDLSGHTADNRLMVFARKPAPIQVTYLGYPNTTGLKTIDYRFTDVWADPKGENDELYTEEIVHLPHSFLCYQPPDNSPEVKSLPALKNNYITFGCFNNLAKVTPELISYWSIILKALPTSQLILKSKSLSDPNTCEYLKKLFQENQINLQQVKMMGWVSDTNQHLDIYNQIDIALDTFPYHGTTTTCEALWMGVPVITLAGNSHVSRVGVSLLSSVELQELIADSVDDYIQKVISLASNQKQLQDLRTNLRQKMLNAPITNKTLITKSIEDAYLNMWQNLCYKKQNDQEIKTISTQSNFIKNNTSTIDKDQKIISFSLWGDNPKYTIGAIKNAQLSPIIYPGWICRFYVAQTVPSDIIAQLLKYDHVEVVKLNCQQDWEASLWRFYPADETNVSIMICRDTDSRLNLREKAAVEAWIKSDLPVHIMRDHPLHFSPIMAGMWGVKKGVFQDIKGMIELYLKNINYQYIVYGIDQRFLANIIYPLVQNRSLIHDEFFACKSFPKPRNNDEFVGQVFEANDTTPSGNIAQLKTHLFLQAQGKLYEEDGYSRHTLEINSHSTDATKNKNKVSSKNC